MTHGPFPHFIGPCTRKLTHERTQKTRIHYKANSPTRLRSGGLYAVRTRITHSHRKDTTSSSVSNSTHTLIRKVLHFHIMVRQLLWRFVALRFFGSVDRMDVRKETHVVEHEMVHPVVVLTDVLEDA